MKTNSSAARVRIIEGAEARALTREQRWELLSPYLMQHGRGCLAYSTLQDGLDYFIVEQKGYIASKTLGRICPTTIALGDPICDGSQLRSLLDEFLKARPKSSFIQISRQTAVELVERGFYANQCGIETWIEMEDWNLSGHKKQNLRTSLNKAQKAGITIAEFSCSRVDPDQLRNISSEWCTSKTNMDGELVFLARPIVYSDETFVRKFCARNGEQILGFVVFDPLFLQGKTAGYVVDILRARNQVPPGLLYAIQCHAFEQFKSEGLKMLSLGWSPFSRIEDGEGFNSPFITLLLIALFQLGSKFYRFKGLAQNKREFRGEEMHVYLATRHKYPLLQLYHCFRACNINPMRQLIGGRSSPKC